MKPDKHKQKKSNEYKKKHGIRGKTEKDDLTTQTKNRDMCKKDSVSKSEANSNPDATTRESSKNELELFKYETNGVDFEANGSSEEQDLGEELSDILRDTANTVFQYQYHQASFFDEIGNYSTFEDKYSDIVSVCPNHLEKILLCTPLHKRLNLEENIFEPEDLLKMQLNADKCLQATLGLSLKNHSREININEVEVTFDTTSLMSAKREKAKVPRDVLKVQETPAKVVDSSTASEHDRNITTSAKNMPKNPTSASFREDLAPMSKLIQERKPTFEELEAELDALLNM